MDAFELDSDAVTGKGADFSNVRNSSRNTHFSVPVPQVSWHGNIKQLQSRKLKSYYTLI